MKIIDKLLGKADPLDSLLVTSEEAARLKAWNEGYEKGLAKPEQAIGGRKQTRLPCSNCYKETVHAFAGKPENLVYCLKCGNRNYESTKSRDNPGPPA